MTVMSDNGKYHFYPYLRKGLNSHITEIDSLGKTASEEMKTRGTVKMSIGLDLGKGDTPHTHEEYEKVFELFGPGDVSGISESAVMQTVPANGDNGYCNDYLAAIEFYEEDLPWRYTPFAANGDCLRPWMSLILCKDGEFTEETAGNGMKIIRLNLNEDNYSEVLHNPSDSHLYAHVQLISPTADINAFLEDNPDAGISRIFCPRKIEGGPLASQHIHYTAFLIPSFELGRRRGLCQSIDGVNMQQHAWPEHFSDAKTEDMVFPVYYQWSFTSGGDRFCDLANKLRPVDKEEYAGFSPYITADINDCGLGAYKVDAEKEPENLMDPIGVPVACVNLGFSEQDVEENHSETAEMRRWMKEKLLDKNPVFYENKLVLRNSKEVANMDEDPWVVPPIYGAKQALSTELKWNGKGQPEDWVSEQNLTFRHRIAGGLGKKVVQNNQEDFVQRAWLQVEQINSLNQAIRERLSSAKLDSSAKKQIDTGYEKRKKNNTSSATSGFSTDSFVKTVHLSHQPELDAKEIINHLDLVQNYAKGDYRNSAAVSDDFIEALLKEDRTESQIQQNHLAHLISENNMIKVASGIGSAYPCISPAAAWLYSMFDVHYNGLDINIKEGTLKLLDNKVPFEFYTEKDIECTKEWFKLDNEMLQFSLVWLSGFDNYPGDKDCYDDDCNSSTILELIKTYNSNFTLSPKTFESCELMAGAASLKDNVLPFKIVIKGSDEKGFLLPDPTYRRIFGHLISGEKNRYGLGVEYTLGPKKNARKKTIHFFPASAIAKNYATGKLSPQAAHYKNEDGCHSDGYVEIKKDYFVGELFDSFVEGSVSKDYDFRQNWDQGGFRVERKDHCFVLPPQSLGEAYYTRFFSRYGTICQMIDDFVGKVKSSYMGGHCFCTIGSNLSMEWSPSYKKGWICLRTKKKRVTPDGKVYKTHKIVFKDCMISGMIVKENGKFQLNVQRVYDELTSLKTEIEVFARNLYNPDVYEFDLSLWENSFNTYNAWTLIDGDNQLSKIQGKDEQLWKLLKSEREYWNSVDKVPEAPKPVAEQTAETDKPLIDPSEEALTKMTEVLTRYYGSGKHVDIEKLMRSKYPVMAYPEYPDPTYFYLREISERFILPSAGELPANSISLFMSNAKFEEAFLSGMNTEMGHELLWREYPTDERGSYFRKFWDSEEDPTSDGYWDVEMMHEWKGRLGDNHVPGKGALLIFAIKGELLQCYPQTFLYLTKYPEQANTGSTVIYPAMTSWLTGDTFIAGFRTSDLDGSTDSERIQNLIRQKYYLALQERDSSMHFDHASKAVSGNSAQWASSRLHQPMIWAMPCENAVIL